MGKFILIAQKIFESIYNGDKSNSARGLNRGLSSNFWWLISSNSVKFTEECVMRTEKHVLAEKCLQIGLMWFCYNNDMVWKYIDSQVKKKFLAQQSVRMIIILRDIDIGFVVKSCNSD